MLPKLVNLLIPSKKLLQKFFLSRPYSVLRGLYIFIPLFSYLLSFFLQMLVILGVWPNLDVYHSMCRGYVGRLIIMFIGIRSLPVKHFIQTSRELCVLSDRNRGLQISDLLHFVFAFFLLNFLGSFVFLPLCFCLLCFCFFFQFEVTTSEKTKKILTPKTPACEA